MDFIATNNEVKTEGWMGGHYEFTGSQEEQVWFLDLDPVPESIIIHLKNKGILKIVEKTKNKLIKLKESKEKFVGESKKANDDLIEMI